MNSLILKACRKLMPAVLIFYMFVYSSEALALECAEVSNSYNDKIRQYLFRDALDILSKCQEECPKSQKDFCGFQTIAIKATIRNYIGIQIKSARENADINDGIALRAYQRAVEAGSSISFEGNSRDEINEARKGVASLQEKINLQVASLATEAEQAIDELRFDKARDLIFEIYSLDNGSADAQKLSALAVDRLEDYMENNSREIDQLLKSLDTTVNRAVSEKSPQRKKKLKQEIDLYAQKIDSKVKISLLLKPGDQRIVSLYSNMTSVSNRSRKNGVTVSFDVPDSDQLETPTVKLQAAIASVNKGRYQETISTLKYFRSGAQFDIELLSQAYIYEGIAWAAQINESTANAPKDRLLRLNAKKAFKSALSLNAHIQLPRGYSKYNPILEETRHLG